MSRKPPRTAAAAYVADAMGEMSKAALFDIVCDLVALTEGRADQPITRAELATAANPVLRFRGDRLLDGGE